VIQDEHNGRADDRDQKTPGIKSVYAYAACCVKDEASNEGPDDAEDNVEDDTLAAGR
jgi:hypothetical protein